MLLIHRFELPERKIEVAAWKVMQEADRRQQLCRNNKPFPSLEEQSVIIVGDGLGSGYSMLAAGLPAPLLLKKFNLLTDYDVVRCLASAARASPGSEEIARSGYRVATVSSAVFRQQDRCASSSHPGSPGCRP